MFVPLALEVFAGVHVAGAGFGNGKLAQQSVFVVVHDY